MKNYEEMAQSALHKIEQHNQKINQRKRRIKQFALPVSCCLLLLIGVQLKNQYVSVPESEEYLSNSSGLEEIQQNEVLDNSTALYFNEVEKISVGSKRYFDPQLHHIENWNLDEISNYFGEDFSKLCFDSLLSLNYVSRDCFPIMLTNDGKIVDDWSHFSYQNDQQVVAISVSKIQPPYDTLYEYHNPQLTIFNTPQGNKEILLGQIKKEKVLIADFQFNRLYYRVQGRNVKENDFYQIISTLLCNES